MENQTLGNKIYNCIESYFDSDNGEIEVDVLHKQIMEIILNHG